MKQRGLKTYDDLISYHIGKVRKSISDKYPKKTCAYWSNEATLYQKLREDDVLVYWGLSKDIGLMKKTYPKNKIVMSAKDFYYMDCGLSNKYGSITHCDPYKSYWTIYSFEPSDYVNDGTVLGSELAGWSELFTDAILHSRLWLRAAALPDRLWGPKPSTVDVAALVNRLNAFGEKLK